MNILNKKLIRDIKRSKGQVIAVTILIMCGIASFVCFFSSYRNLKLSRDSYYSQSNFADFYIPLEKAPNRVVYTISNIKGVKTTRGRIVKDVSLDIQDDDRPKIGRVISLPDKQNFTINNIYLTAGRYFSSDQLDEVIINDRFAKANNLKISDPIFAIIDNKKHKLKIIGTALSPEFVYMIRNSQEIIPNPENFCVLYVRKEFAEMAFDMSESCNEILGLTDNDANLDELLEIAKKKLEPYGVFTTIKKKDQLSNHYLSMEIEELSVTATIDPFIFLGVASSILLIMLGRLVKRQRGEIGLLKAYGYSNWMIMTYYLKFALFIALNGALLGFVTGQILANSLMKWYVVFFQLPIYKAKFYTDILIMSIVISAVFGLIGASNAAYRVMKIAPAESMRPESPKSAKKLLLEKITFFWENLSFTGKVIMRNIFRYKIRSFFSVLGVGLATSILIVGYFSFDSVNFLINNYFFQTQKQNVKVAFESERGKDAFYELKRLNYVRKAEPVFEYPFEIRKGWRKKDIVVTGLTKSSRLLKLMDSNGKTINISESGLMIPEIIANEMEIKVGDTVTLKPLMGKITKEMGVRVDSIITQYIGLGAYMNIEQLSKIMDEGFVINSTLLDVEEDKIMKLNKDLKDVPAIAVVEIKDDVMKNLKETFQKLLNVMGTFLTFFAGVIAFAIIYNSTSITIMERQRELASLRVLGFTPKEVGNIVFNENILLSIIGIILGIPIGLYFCKLLVKAYETDLFRFPFYIRNETFVISAITILAFVIISNLISKRKINQLNLVEVLKSPE